MMEISIEKCNDPTILRYLYYNDNKLDGIVRWYSLKKLKKRGNEIKKRGGTRPCSSLRKLCLRLSDLYLYIHKLNNTVLSIP